MRTSKMDEQEMQKLLISNGVSESAVGILADENVLQGKLCSKLTDHDMEELGINLRDRKKILAIIDENNSDGCDAPAKASSLEPSDWDKFLWGLVGFFTLFPFNILIYEYLRGNRRKDAHSFGWGIVWNIILAIVLIVVGAILLSRAMNQIGYYGGYNTFFY